MTVQTRDKVEFTTPAQALASLKFDHLGATYVTARGVFVVTCEGTGRFTREAWEAAKKALHVLLLALLVGGCASAPYSSPRVQGYTPKARPHVRPWRGEARRLLAEYDGRLFGRPCPDLVRFVWGMGEAETYLRFDAETCVERLEVEHVFEQRVPRSVRVYFYRDGEEVGSASVPVRP